MKGKEGRRSLPDVFLGAVGFLFDQGKKNQKSRWKKQVKDTIKKGGAEGQPGKTETKRVFIDGDSRKKKKPKNSNPPTKKKTVEETEPLASDGNTGKGTGRVAETGRRKKAVPQGRRRLKKDHGNDDTKRFAERKKRTR